MRRATGLVTICLMAAACGQPDRGHDILDLAYRSHGAANLADSKMEFEFRGDSYSAVRDGGMFEYKRTHSDSSGLIRDRLTNEGVFRDVNGEPVRLDDPTSYSILEKVNSVVYFASLPFPLKDPAVIARYLGDTAIRNRTYHTVEVTFRQEGGGPDYQDRFLYWIDTDTHFIEYMAYYYLTNETGSRFRHLVNPRLRSGFRATDHLNYSVEPDTIGAAVENFVALFESGKLKLVSEVKHENVRVVPLRDITAGASE